MNFAYISFCINFFLVQNELDETKQIVSETLEKILDRGQKLDDLVSRSNELSEQSKERFLELFLTNGKIYGHFQNFLFKKQ